jgi:hypothetical protein
MNFGALFARHIHPEIAGLAHYACELAGVDKLPRRRDLDLNRISSLRDYIFLIEILPDENDYYFSQSGSRMGTLFGTDLAGTHLSEMSDTLLRQSLRKTYDRVVETKQPLFLRGRYVWQDKSVPIERLLIPMVGDDGRVNSICGISIPEIADVDLEMFAGQGPARLVSEDELMLECG